MAEAIENNINKGQLIEKIGEQKSEVKKMKNFCIIMITYLLLLIYMATAVMQQYAAMTVCTIVVAIIIYANLRDEREDDQMTKEKTTERYAITTEQLIEFDKISKELRKIFTENRAAVTRIQKERKKWYKNSNAIRYGELK